MELIMLAGIAVVRIAQAFNILHGYDPRWTWLAMLGLALGIAAVVISLVGG
jgi:hypothetical protein